ncbi:MAG: hypothetical protein MUC88_11845 [Planctomycetes bacterium]|nr:hypothetical protein [Planctomycetota bacterium]
MWVLICLVLLVPAVVAWGQAGYEVEGLEQVERVGPGPIEQMQAAWERWGRLVIGGAGVLLLIAAFWIINPFRIYDSANERRLRRALRSVDDLLKKIQEEAEATSENSRKDEAVPEEGLLAGLAEVAEFTNAEQVPSYVLTVNDLMLDNIRVTLKKLRRLTEGNAERYRGYMFSVLKGIKTLAEQSAEAGAASGLALDVREYFGDDKRYQAWHKLLSHSARRGRHREISHGFLLFMRDLKEGRPLQVPSSPLPPAPEVPTGVTEEAPAIPTTVNEETLPAIQRAALHEARALCTLIRAGKPPADDQAWQFEMVRRQRQVHLRTEAQRMLAVFLSSERKALREITKALLLPCRTWEHTLRLFGVESGDQLRQRIEDKLLTTQEIVLLEKTFLQTFGKREVLVRVYGQDKAAGMMMDLHLPQMRREALALLRRLHEVEPDRLDDATQALNDEETPKNGQIKRLIERYVQQRQDPLR